MMPVSIQEQLDLLRQGTVEIVSEEDLRQKLTESAKGRPLKVKLGLDPTAPDIHLGHTVVLRKLRQFQDLGHEVYLVIGDFTGRIGDPSGKSKTRRQLTEAEVMANAHTYEKQLTKILDGQKTHIVFNSEWLAGLDLAGVIELASRYTLARMLEREDFAQRFRGRQPIALHELLYPLLQGYDSVAIKADVELGGTEQRFNLLVGREMQRKYGQPAQALVICPLLMGTDGSNKMSKSLGNYIGIDEEPAEIFGKIMSIPDRLILPYYELVTDLSPETLGRVRSDLDQGMVNPMDLKIDLAAEIVRMYHGPAEALTAREHFSRVFQRREEPEEMPVLVLSRADLTADGTCRLSSLVMRSGLVSSGNEARRLIAAGGVRINRRKVDAPLLEVEITDGLVLQVGKRRFACVKLI